MNCDSVTPEFNIAKYAHPVVFFFKLNFQTNYLRIHLTDFHQIFTVW